jgi:hypothetical protein
MTQLRNITLPLVGGTNVTFFLGNQNLAVAENKINPDSCHIIDGLHNNGGWNIALPYNKVVKLLFELFSD